MKKLFPLLLFFLLFVTYSFILKGYVIMFFTYSWLKRYLQKEKMKILCYARDYENRQQ